MIGNERVLAQKGTCSGLSHVPEVDIRWLMLLCMDALTTSHMCTGPRTKRAASGRFNPDMMVSGSRFTSSTYSMHGKDCMAQIASGLWLRI